MDIVLIAPTPSVEVKERVEKLGNTVQEVPLGQIPPLRSQQAVVFLNNRLENPPEGIDPTKNSILFIDETFISHPETCYAFSKRWVKELLPVALALFKRDHSPQNDKDLETLFREYRRTLFTKLQLVFSLFQEAVESPSKESLDQLRHQVHKMAGSAGTYNFSSLSKICKKLEGELIEFIERFSNEPTLKYTEEKKNEYIHCIIESCLVEAETTSDPSTSCFSEQMIQKAQAQTSSIDFYLVDDDQELLAIISNEAKKRGISFECEVSFSKAKERLANPGFSPRVALFDLFSPNESITGYDLVDTFRKTKGETLTTLIGIISQKAEVLDRIHASQFGIDVYFEKPVNVRFLLDQIEKVAKGGKKRGANILVVDDDENFCKIVKQSLERGNFQVNYIIDGTSLYSSIEALQPDIILLDINLPNQNGIDLLHTLRADFRYRDITVIIVTASTQPEDVKKAFAAGAQDYLLKPLDFEKLSEYLHRFMRKKEYLGLIYERDSDFGAYTERSLSDFFTTFALQRTFFCAIFFHLINEKGAVISGNRSAKKQIIDMITAFFSKNEIVGTTQGVITLLITDYTIQQLVIILESLFEGIRAQNISSNLIAIATRFPSDGLSLNQIYETSQHIVQERRQLIPWEILFSKQATQQLPSSGISNIILISSDPQMSAILTNALQLRDMAVSPYTSGKEGYEYLVHHFLHTRNAAIILDGDFENENGNVLLQKIKNIVGQRTPLYFLTSLSKEEDLSESLSLGATRIFSKPIQLQILLDTLEKDIGGS